MSASVIFDDLTALGDETRSRMLLVLERHELTVGELGDVLQLPQSTVSRHLKTLSDANWVASRRDGTSRLYMMPLAEMETFATDLWEVVRENVASSPAASDDDRRLKQILALRRTKSEEF